MRTYFAFADFCAYLRRLACLSFNSSENGHSLFHTPLFV